MPRRKRCNGPCGELYDPAELTRVGNDWLCQACQQAEAEMAVADQAADTTEAADEPEEFGVRADLAPGDDPAAETERVRIRELKMTEHQRMIEAGEHPAVSVLADTVPVDVDDLLDTFVIHEPPPSPFQTVTELPPDQAQALGFRRRLPSVNLPGWPLRHGRVSASALATFARCPEQFRLKYVLGYQEPQAAAPLTGSAVHGAMEKVWEAKIAGLLGPGEAAQEKGLTEAYYEKFESLTERAGGRGEVVWDEGGRGKPTDPSGWREMGLTVAAEYNRVVAPTIQPVATEEVLTIDVPGVPVPLVGYLDLVTATETIDLKVSGKAHTEVATDWRLQGYVYLLAGRSMAWHSVKWPNAQGEVAISIGKPGEGPYLPLTAEALLVAQNLVRRYVKAILAYSATFGRDEPWPGAVNHTWACNLCRFRTDGRCAWWNGDFPDSLF
jgi:hypothetical protein